MGYHGEWNATEASPQRAVDAGLIDRFGSIDPDRRRATPIAYSVAGEWQHGTGHDADQGSGLRHRLRPRCSSPTSRSILDDPVHGDQKRAGRSPVRRRACKRFSSGRRAGAGITCRTRSASSCATTTSRERGAVPHRERACRLDTRSDDSAVVTSRRRLRARTRSSGRRGSGRRVGAARRRIAVHVVDTLDPRQQRHGERRARQPERRR